ncbi:NUMOD3 domain-containing DNA-binding protein [Burkholderia cenocepacia]|uniref:NUMOD3 domain-containing DNA-binding protein n=1 Tax=Burkholderia cenocepacia TaxID=95486 RepID=UPI001B9B09BE|nr:NUMOD3 domain-containing DNA-binding protein [Burkholderia cenocepacia]MBR8475834.1 GIY-YIG nuclease family protein [Burkholderia cenocepacia]
MIAAGIYRIVVERGDLPPKFYIGQTINLKKRQSEHIAKLRSGTAHNQALQNAFSQYGEASVRFEPVLICSRDPETLALYEQIVLNAYIERYGARGVFNYRVANVNSSIGTKRSDETRARISAALKGRQLSPDSIARGVAKRIGRKQSVEAIAKRTAKQTGIKRSAETRARMSEAARARGVSPETIAKGLATRAANRAARGGAISERHAAHLRNLADRNRKTPADGANHGR